MLSPDQPLVAFDGRLDEREALAEALALDPGRHDDAALVHAAYLRFGAQLPEQLSGDFALAVFDPREQRLLLARDGVGLRALLYARIPGGILFGTAARALLAHGALAMRPNAHHLAEFLAGAAPAQDGGLTFLEGIEALPPGHRLLASADGVRIERYWDFPDRTVQLASAAEYRDAFRERFTAAVRRRLRGDLPVAVAVSGGVDSSAVYCTAARLREAEPGLPAVVGLTEAHPGDPAADELRYVEAIEARYAVPIHRLPGGGFGDLASWTRQVWHSEIPRLHPFALATERRVAATAAAGARTLLGGEWGDAIAFDQSYLVDLVRRGAWGTALRHLRTIPAWFQDADPRPFRHQLARDLLRSSLPAPLVELLRGVRHRAAGGDPLFERAPALRPFLGTRRQAPARRASEHAASLYRTIRSRSAALDLGAMARTSAPAGVQLALPFVDRELLTLVMAIPGDALSPGGVPKGLLREAMRGVMPDEIVARRWKADFSHLAQVGLRQYFVTLQEYLRGHCAAVDFGMVGGDALRRALARWEGQAEFSLDDVWSILQVLGLELWLQSLAGSPPD